MNGEFVGAGEGGGADQETPNNPIPVLTQESPLSDRLISHCTPPLPPICRYLLLSLLCCAESHPHFA